MSYQRGGKVWIDGSGCGWVALEEDWSGGLLPEDLVAEAGLIGVDFKLVDHGTRAAMGGYAKVDNRWLFFLSHQSMEFHPIKGVPVYLLGDFNNWKCAPRYQLTETTDGWGAWINLEILEQFDQCEFKFFSGDGRWMEPHEHFPAYIQEETSIRNSWFHQKRTGRDLFSFRLIKPQGSQGAEKWAQTRPTGSFGFSYDGSRSSFRIFAPRAENVELFVFNNPAKTKVQKFAMEISEDGSWSFESQENLSGKHYQYSITQKDNREAPYTKEIIDPYARAMVGRNGPAVALNLPPRGVDEKFNPPYIGDAVVVEAHLRDLLAHASCDLTDAERLEFGGLTRYLQSEDCYLRKLGANVVELQPVHEFDARAKEDYHWGYMPVNFFSPASVYSNNPTDGSVIQEFSQLVKSFHDAGLAVVLDVVYNHVGIPPHLMHLDMGIYCLSDEKGNLTNFSGCGNDLRCEAEPVKKIIIDSLIYWVEVFDVDGFRFDLGELLGFELLSEIELELKKIKPGILLFAEPWSFRGRLPSDMKQTSFALWSDACREELLNYAKNESGKDLVVKLLTHGLDPQNLTPYQSVNYLESHDDYSLVDRFRDLAVWQDQDTIPDEVIYRIMVAMGLLMLAPGVPMISAGQDFLRHKNGIRNTYTMGEVNALDYKLEQTYASECRFIRDLIKLRLSEPGRRSRSAGADEWEIHSFSSDLPSVIAMGWKSLKTLEKFLIIANPTTQKSNVNLPDSWRISPKLLAGYRSNDSDIGQAIPLSFSWFSLS